MDPTLPPQTPARPSQNKRKSQADTPRKAPLAATQDYQSTKLDKRRDALVKDIRKVPEVPVSFLFGAVLRPISKDYIQEVARKLKQGRHLTKGSDGRWKEFPNDPSAADKREDLIFAPLVKVWDTIVTLGKQVLQSTPTIKFEQDPHKVPISDRGDLSRPDGQCSLINPGEFFELLGLLFSYYCTVVSWEFKRKDNEKAAVDNARKVLWSCHLTLLTDPRRRFTFGITIEDTQTRVWFVSRTCVIATERFNFVEEPQLFIHLVLALAFANDEELGFDTSMSACSDPDLPELVQFKMKVAVKTYVTRRPLSDYSADAIIGRGMRVWEAYEEGVPNISVVLKDAWILADSLSEGEQLRRLHERLESIIVSPGERHPKEYFLTVLNHAFICLSDNTRDDTIEVMMRGENIPDGVKCVQTTLEEETISQSQVPSERLPTPIRSATEYGAMTLRAQNVGLPAGLPGSSPTLSTAQWGARNHYRIIFKEVGTPVNDLRSLALVMNALADTVQALKILHEIGFVHRDITPTNILVASDGVAKVSDLEYLKSIRMTEENAAPDLEGSTMPNEHKTGNEDFIPLEVSAGDYILTPRKYFDEATGRMSELLTPRPAHAFRFNPLHDIESTFWIYFRTLVRYSSDEEPLLPTQADIFRLVFQGALKVANRLPTMRRAHKLEQSHFPRAFSNAVEILKKVTILLVDKYEEVDFYLATHPIEDPGNFKGIHEVFIKLYREAAAKSANVPIFLVDEVYKNPTRGHESAGKESEVAPAEDNDPQSESSGPLKRLKLLPVACASSSRASSSKSNNRLSNTKAKRL
ncbi:hypothetical protein B0H10DRAFT_279558 [Mycena sp. CBHHK59/15]|nr:hypothetical protein B0H10DRAFT_279558 [Mycena sp. CBHHK59/15]